MFQKEEKLESERVLKFFAFYGKISRNMKKVVIK